jgi:N,N'-diacetylchitobiose transport system permease protein
MSAIETEIVTEPSRRPHRRPLPGRPAGGAGRGGRSVPYLLIAPTLAILTVIFGYPLYVLVKTSFEDYRAKHLFSGRSGDWIGLQHYKDVLSDGFFWTVVARTFGMAFSMVALTILAGTLVALLMERVSKPVRNLISFGLVFVWAMPVLVAITTWQWMVDFQFGVVNWVVTQLHIADYATHNWFASAWQGFLVITTLVVWMSIPFVAITLYAGLTQVPREMIEAAVVDGASSWQIFRNVTMPILRPLYAIVITLSIIWDFGVFTQIWVMLNQNPSQDYFVLGIYAFAEAFQGSNYGLASAIAIVTVFLLIAFTFVYIRRMLRVGEAQ